MSQEKRQRAISPHRTLDKLKNRMFGAYKGLRNSDNGLYRRLEMLTSLGLASF